MARPIRLGKAAGELNVGMSTLVDFLESKVVDKLQAFDRRTRLRKTVQDA